uniref:Uncharacterized protein n=1 Tax=Musa acuminata subsp. malaccensis TaxID=214687 RepID=A0A804JW91_MUSAM
MFMNCTGILSFFFRFATHMTDDESRKARRFERGLRPAIRSRMSALKLQTYADTVERALKIE